MLQKMEKFFIKKRLLGHLTLKQMFDISASSVSEQEDEISGLETIFMDLFV